MGLERKESAVNGDTECGRGGFYSNGERPGELQVHGHRSPSVFHCAAFPACGRYVSRRTEGGGVICSQESLIVQVLC